MSQNMVYLFGAILVVLSLLIAVMAWYNSIRWVREYRASMDQTVRAKDQAIQSRDEQLESNKGATDSLKQEIAFLKELDSVRFAQRYLATKNALEQRLNRLGTHRTRWRERAKDVQRRLEELALSREQKTTELSSLRSELAKTLHDSRTLEQALQAVSTLGAIPVADLQAALSRRRRKQSEISSRLEQLGLEGEEKVTEMERLSREADRARAEADRLEREIEITRAAGPILDSLLGVTSRSAATTEPASSPKSSRSRPSTTPGAWTSCSGPRSARQFTPTASRRPWRTRSPTAFRVCGTTTKC